jgi:hypothetical protein
LEKVDELIFINNLLLPIYGKIFIFDRSQTGVRYTGIINWNGNFNVNEKNEIRDHMEEYLCHSDEYEITRKEQYIEIRRKLTLRGGMDFEGPIETDFNDFDMSFVDTFLIDEDFEVTELLRVQLENVRNEDNTITFIPNEAVIDIYKEEAIRTGREDTRFDEEILRTNNTINIQANINAIVENLGRLAEVVSNMVITNIEWNRMPHLKC